jgi:hypothetical protein
MAVLEILLIFPLLVLERGPFIKNALAPVRTKSALLA